ncbi:hypothetical protein AD017_30755 (plasmid) [Pseudonocardia sp. EC080619-01]|nr:hypothetical protein AD017_30755 [Pseudonocardia sp. EC080619-01]
MWRWVAEFTEPELGARSDRYELTDTDVDAFTRWRGNVAAVHRELHADRADGLSLRRLQYAFTEQLTPGQRAGLVDARRVDAYSGIGPRRRGARRLRESTVDSWGCRPRGYDVTPPCCRALRRSLRA